MPRPYHDADWLHERYHGDGATQREIAEECDVSPRAIRKWMKRHDIETRNVEGENHGLYGMERSEETKRKIAEALEDRTYEESWCQRLSERQKGRELAPSTKDRISRALEGHEKSIETRWRMSEARRGEGNPMYIDGESDTYGPGWRVARDRVRERDGICQSCGDDGSDRSLEVHHIIPVSNFRVAEEADLSEAHELSNLVLLCRDCHEEAEWGDLSFESGIADPLGN